MAHRLGVLGLFAAVLVLLTCFAPEIARAQAPGPMSRGHAKLVGPLSCVKCHEGGSGVPDSKCLGCHDHRNLRERIEAGKGFHADPEVKKKECKACHVEHVEEPPGSGRGRRTTRDWKPFGGERNFPHQRTGWPLEGAHRFQKCEKCHKATSSKVPGLIVYLGLRAECTSCHKMPHQLADERLSDCRICHGFDSRRVPNLGSTRFDHDKTKFPIEGFHAKNACTKCHTTTKVFTIGDRSFEDCRGCHKDPHRSVISASRKCSACHNQKVQFEKNRFDHAKETKFALRGQHAKNECKSCHKPGKTDKPATACASCHADEHRGRFGKETCDGCHGDGGPGWKQIHFDHNKKTKFELTGSHAKTACATCHRDKEPKGFERFEQTSCTSCHRHQDAHCGQFGAENCERCHVRGGDRTSRFDHNLTRFRLDGAHAKPECTGQCHKPAKLGESAACKKATRYTGLDPECKSCHEDVHEKTLGDGCSKCHTGGIEFKSLVFDHDQDSQFPLTGFHEIVDCRTCHPSNQQFKLRDTTCLSCHWKDDVHKGKLGPDCARCHETTGGAPKFDHAVHTSFERSGVHARIECQRCHFLPAVTGDPKQQKADVVAVATAPPGAPLDLEFRTRGKSCASCHPNPHGVAKELDCGGCHGSEVWGSPPKNGYHERAGFSLTGAHTTVQCGVCHRGAGRMTGRGEQCALCHSQDDAHAGSFGGDCGKCHGQLAWLPSTYSHNDTGYMLEGVHRTLDCRECHRAGNFFIGSRCYNCHMDDYRSAQWHLREVLAQRDSPKTFIGGAVKNGSFATADCGECHNQFTFFQATYQTPASVRGQRQ